MTKDDTVIITGDFGGVWFGDSRDDETLIGWNACPSRLPSSAATTKTMGALERYPVAEWHGGKVHCVRPQCCT